MIPSLGEDKIQTFQVQAMTMAMFFASGTMCCRYRRFSPRLQRTPKELRLIAQGCEHSELPWVNLWSYSSNIQDSN